MPQRMDSFQPDFKFGGQSTWGALGQLGMTALSGMATHLPGGLAAFGGIGFGKPKEAYDAVQDLGYKPKGDRVNEWLAYAGPYMQEAGEWIDNKSKDIEQYTGIPREITKVVPQVAAEMVGGGALVKAARNAMGKNIPNSLPTVEAPGRQGGMSWGGDLAVGAPVDQLDDAVKAFIDGKPRIAGNPWRLGAPDGKGRFWISDKDFKIMAASLDHLPTKLAGKKKSTGFMQLWEDAAGIVQERKTVVYAPEIFKHDKLYEAYPEMRNIKVIRLPANSKKQGSMEVQWDDKGNVVGGVLEIQDQGHHVATGAIILHELQHFIQAKEAFAPGSSVKFYQKIADNKTTYARDAKRAANTYDIAQLMQRKGKGFTKEQARAELDIAAKDYNFRDLAEHLMGVKEASLQDLMAKKNMAITTSAMAEGLSKKGAYWNYLRTTGEIEAREVAKMYEHMMLGQSEKSILKGKAWFEEGATNRVDHYGQDVDIDKAIDLPPETSAGQAFVKEGSVGTGAMALNPSKNVDVYHASMANFDKFDMKYIGTGEGAAAKGIGLYVAESAQVSGPKGHYTKIFQGILDNKRGTLTTRINAMEERLKQPRGVSNVEAMQYRNSIADMKKELNNTDYNATSYKLHIPDEYVEKMLDWDLPLSKQPKVIQDLAATLPTPAVGSSPSRHLWEGGDVYKELAIKLRGADKASKYLKELGFPGAKYFDGDSRQLTYGTKNYVLYDETIAQIIHKTRGGKTEVMDKSFLEIPK